MKTIKYFVLTTFCFTSSSNAFLISLRRNDNQNEKLNPLQASTLKILIETNNEKALDKLLQEKAFNLNATGLLYSVKFNFSDISRRSYKSSARSTDQFTPLTFATSYAKPALVHMLLSAGSDKNKGITVENMVYYPLTIAYSENFTDIEELFPLMDITEEFLQKNISREHFNQALDFTNSTIEKYSQSRADILRRLLVTSDFAKAQTVKQMKLPLKALTNHSEPWVAKLVEEYL